jgi:hypothetical protein
VRLLLSELGQSVFILYPEHMTAKSLNIVMHLPALYVSFSVRRKNPCRRPAQGGSEVSLGD